MCENLKAAHQKDNNCIKVNAIYPNMLYCHEYMGQIMCSQISNIIVLIRNPVLICKSITIILLCLLHSCVPGIWNIPTDHMNMNMYT